MIESPLLQHLSGYIGGRWVAAESGKTIDVMNPANGELLARVPDMGAGETAAAIAAAKAAQRNVPDVAQRRQWLQVIHDLLIREKKEIGRILCLEHGKPWKEAQAEVEYAASFFGYYADVAQEVLAPESLPGRDRGCAWTVYKRPIGVVGLITPWNFPIAMIAKKIAPAIAAGCASVIKPASETPLTMIAAFDLLSRHVDFPKGFINLVIGRGGAIGGELMGSFDVRMVSFTGSTEVGQLLVEQSREHVQKLGLELGGNAPFIVLDDADLDAAADGLIANKFRGSGQTCVCANRVYVQSGVYDAFSEKVVERVQALRVGDGMADTTDIGPLINAAGFDKVKDHLADALSKGARLVLGQPPETLDSSKSLFFSPTVITNVSQDMRCCQEETFGPLLPLIPFETDEQAVERANDTAFGLAAYVFGRDSTRAQRLIAQLHFGHCGCNTGTGPAAHAPFGGMLHSGVGREGGKEGLLEYVEVQTVPDGSLV